LPASGEVFTWKAHDERRFVHGDRRQRVRPVDVANRIADVHVFDTGHGNDVAGNGRFHGFARQTFEREHLLDLRGAVIFAAVPQLDHLPGFHRATPDAADADAADV
jgi:hypothetical protein